MGIGGVGVSTVHVVIHAEVALGRGLENVITLVLQMEVIIVLDHLENQNLAIQMNVQVSSKH